MKEGGSVARDVLTQDILGLLLHFLLLVVVLLLLIVISN